MLGLKRRSLGAYSHRHSQEFHLIGQLIHFEEPVVFDCPFFGYVFLRVTRMLCYIPKIIRSTTVSNKVANTKMYSSKNSLRLLIFAKKLPYIDVLNTTYTKSLSFNAPDTKFYELLNVRYK